MLRFVLFDLDNTLYPRDSGLWDAIGHRINLYMIERLSMPPEEVAARRERYLSAFGTTLNALRHYYGTDPDDFLSFVHDLPIRSYLRPDPDLDGMLRRLTMVKVIFTNADAQHARRVLSCLGIAHHFDRIIDIHALEFINKPDPRAYLKALEFVSAQANECVLVEDSLQNVVPARRLGMTTVLVGDGVSTCTDYQVPRIIDLERYFPTFLGDREFSSSGPPS
jgi:putative hydrolase of the HAD superfamily